MNGAKILLVLSVLMVAAVLLNGVGFSAPPTTKVPATSPAASKPTYPLWDGKESVADYAKRAGIKETELTLNLDGNVTLKLTLVPAGRFFMGSPTNEKGRNKNEGPQHEVTISKPSYMGIFEVTQDQYQQVMGQNPSNYKGARNPVEKVSWNDAVAFCKRLSQKTGNRVNLPTEAQWEYACRAGSKSRFGFGDDEDNLGDYAWSSKNSGAKTHPVGQKKPNDWGLYDMHGNVWELCNDWYADSYASAGNTDPSGPVSGSLRVLRGDCWLSYGVGCRSAVRSGGPPGKQLGSAMGFRVVVDLK